MIQNTRTCSSELTVMSHSWINHSFHLPSTLLPPSPSGSVLLSVAMRLTVKKEGERERETEQERENASICYSLLQCLLGPEPELGMQSRSLTGVAGPNYLSHHLLSHRSALAGSSSQDLEPKTEPRCSDVVHRYQNH